MTAAVTFQSFAVGVIRRAIIGPSLGPEFGRANIRGFAMRLESIHRLLLVSLLLAVPASDAIAQTLPVSTTSASIAAASPATVTYSTVFRPKPLDAFKQVAMLQVDASKSGVTRDEFELLNAATDRRVSEWSMTEAALIICGATDAGRRQHYLSQLKAIAEEADKATAAAKTPVEKAKALAKFLHEKPMHAGYVHEQSNLCVLLDTGQYNCVSSAVLFNIMARHQKLKVAVVTIPRHVFSRMAGFDIEPTSGHVYPADIRIERIFKSRKESDDRADSPYANQIYRETDNLGLLASVYFNAGCQFAREKRYDDAVQSDLKAACLDPKDPVTVRNIQLNFKHWFRDAVKRNDYRTAASIARLYRTLLVDPAPADAMLESLKSAGQRAA